MQSILITFDSNSSHWLILVSICRTRETGHMARRKICATRQALYQAGFVQLILMVVEKCRVCRSKTVVVHKVFSIITTIISIINDINTLTIMRQKKVYFFIYSRSDIVTLTRLSYVTEDKKNNNKNCLFHFFLNTWRATETEWLATDSYSNIAIITLHLKNIPILPFPVTVVLVILTTSW